MVKKKIYKFISALCLSLAVLLPTVVKTVHIEEQHHCEHACPHPEETQHEEHDCTSCPICQFLFFSFTEVNFNRPVLKPTVFHIRVYAFISRDVYNITQHCNYLRGPPLFAA